MVETTGTNDLLKWLSSKFPNKVKSVLVDYDGKKIFYKVIFFNGHMLMASENDIKSDDFLATCAMVYDL